MYHQLMMTNGYLRVYPSIVGHPARSIELAFEDQLGILEIVVALVDEDIFKLKPTQSGTDGYHCLPLLLRLLALRGRHSQQL